MTNLADKTLRCISCLSFSLFLSNSFCFDDDPDELPVAGASYQTMSLNVKKSDINTDYEYLSFVDLVLEIDYFRLENKFMCSIESKLHITMMHTVVYMVLNKQEANDM